MIWPVRRTMSSLRTAPSSMRMTESSTGLTAMEDGHFSERLEKANKSWQASGVHEVVMGAAGMMVRMTPEVSTTRSALPSRMYKLPSLSKAIPVGKK